MKDVMMVFATVLEKINACVEELNPVGRSRSLSVRAIPDVMDDIINMTMAYEEAITDFTGDQKQQYTQKITQACTWAVQSWFRQAGSTPFQHYMIATESMDTWLAEFLDSVVLPQNSDFESDVFGPFLGTILADDTVLGAIRHEAPRSGIFFDTIETYTNWNALAGIVDREQCRHLLTNYINGLYDYCGDPVANLMPQEVGFLKAGLQAVVAMDTVLDHEDQILLASYAGRHANAMHEIAYRNMVMSYEAETLNPAFRDAVDADRDHLEKEMTPQEIAKHAIEGACGFIPYARSDELPDIARQYVTVIAFAQSQDPQSVRSQDAQRVIDVIKRRSEDISTYPGVVQKWMAYTQGQGDILPAFPTKR
jgi:hypothetical protein